MPNLLKVTAIGLISGIIGTSIGGLVAFFIKKISKRLLCFILEFSAGLMTSVVCFELIPESFARGNAFTVICGVISGIIIIVAIDSYIRKLDILAIGYKNSSLLKVGVLMAIGIAMHNFPEGFAVGSGFYTSSNLGITITAVILIHDIPEGIAMAVPMKAGGFSAARSFLYTVVSGIPMGFGAFLGAVFGELSERFIPLCLAFAAGAMLYIVFGELIPESKRMYLGRLSSMGNILGILCGIIVSIIN